MKKILLLSLVLCISPCSASDSGSISDFNAAMEKFKNRKRFGFCTTCKVPFISEQHEKIHTTKIQARGRCADSLSLAGESSQTRKAPSKGVTQHNKGKAQASKTPRKSKSKKPLRAGSSLASDGAGAAAAADPLEGEGFYLPEEYDDESNIVPSMFPSKADPLGVADDFYEQPQPTFYDESIIVPSDIFMPENTRLSDIDALLAQPLSPKEQRTQLSAEDLAVLLDLDQEEEWENLG